MKAISTAVLASARIAGKLTYRSRREARIDPAAQIGGGITRLPVEEPSLLVLGLGGLVLYGYRAWQASRPVAGVAAPA